MLKQSIIELEFALLNPEVRHSASTLDRLIHDDFLEIGATGLGFGKPEILRRLPEENSPKFTVIDIQFRQLSEDIAQLTYRASFKPINALDKRYSLRTSLWKYAVDRWQIIYHQGTPCEPF
ncbi:DUF4440 domain-containing protein [Shewanella algidipiscicola]|uniref:DUF4440 domain-containing protein n=1 Tax=Shewanella algidipiscicola TaxID=614070 RepID=A0ABQ4P2K8_9GAMM|nr:DUF4440 domain-containing protein [Shewanella algidipiscicola]GIU41734.1 hypothetical protein TUM4630_01070 [Shewanella algidipiscicola]